MKTARERIARWLTTSAVLTAVVVAAPPLRGDDRTRASTAALVGEADAAYRRGEYRHAAELFEQAHELDPVPSLEVNAAQAWRLAGELGRAADAYAAALAVGSRGNALRPDERAFAARKLEELRKAVATLNVDEPRGARATVGHLHDAPIPLVVHLMPGEHEITIVKADGGVVKKTLQLSAGEARTFGIVAEAAPVPSPTAPPVTAAPRAPPAAPLVATAEPNAGGIAPIRAVGWTAVGASVLLGGATGYFGVRTLGAVDRWNASNLTDLDAYDDARRYKTLTNVMVVATVATLAIGVLLLVVPAQRAKPASSRADGPATALRF